MWRARYQLPVCQRWNVGRFLRIISCYASETALKTHTHPHKQMQIKCMRITSNVFLYSNRILYTKVLPYSIIVDFLPSNRTVKMFMLPMRAYGWKAENPRKRWCSETGSAPFKFKRMPTIDVCQTMATIEAKWRNGPDYKAYTSITVLNSTSIRPSQKHIKRVGTHSHIGIK